MFLNKTQFKKWVKDAFKGGGLTVGRVYGGLVICGGTWEVWTEDGYVPNWVKATVMEYAGELPKAGYVFKAKKDNPVQYEIAENKYLDLPSMFMDAKVPFWVTPIIYDENWKNFRFLQNSGTQEIIAVSTYLYDILDMRELGGESRPVGPCSTSRNGSVLIWKNEHSALLICKTDISGNGLDVMNVLATHSFDKEAV